MLAVNALVLAVMSPLCLAQNIFGTVFCREETRGNIPLVGASVSLISGKDTLNTISDNLGRYSFDIKDALEVTIVAKYEGFDDFRETYQLLEEKTAVAIRMNRSSQVLDAAKIKSEIPFVKNDADTVTYNMAALQKMEEDRAINLLMQIPGFSIKNGKLMVWGEFIDKTYVNGKLIFGDNPMSAVALLRADEVKSVRVYETQRTEDKQRGLQNSKKRRVIDIQTFNQFISACDLQAQSRIGALTELKNADNRLRYSSGLSFDSNEEMQQLEIYANVNNVDNAQNGISVTKGELPTLYSDKQHAGASCDYVKKWKDAEWGNSLSAYYRFDYDKVTSNNETIIDRIGADGGIEPLHYEQHSISKSRDMAHQALISADFHKTKLKDIGFSIGISCDDLASDASQKILNNAGSLGIQTQDQATGSAGKSFRLSQDFRWSNPYAESGWIPHITLSGSISNSPLIYYNVDTLTTSATRRFLDGNGQDSAKRLLGAFALKKALIDTKIVTSEVELIYQTEYTNEHKQVLTVDYLLPEDCQTDYMNSYDYTWNYVKQTLVAGYTLTSASVRLLEVRAGLAATNQMDMEVFPEEISVRNRAVTPYVSVSVAPPFRKDKLFVNYSMMGETPALQQIRQRVDDSNPLRLLVGNPDLKTPLVHKMGISYLPHITSAGSSFSLQCLLGIIINPIINRIEYYASPSLINVWGVDYEIPAGGTLTGYENADFSMSADCGASYDFRIKPLKGIMKTSANFSWRKTPEFDGDYLNYMTGINPSFNVSLTAMPVRFLRLGLSSATGYAKSMTGADVLLSESVYEKCTASADLRFLQHAFCDARYTASFYRYLNGFGADMHIHHLSCALGYLFLDGNLAVSISGSDMLNSAPYYSTNANGTEFIQQNGASLGRYCLLNIAYSFSNRK